MSRKLDV